MSGCKHVTAESLESALEHGGRYWDGERWVCVICDDPRGFAGYRDRLTARPEVGAALADAFDGRASK